jgi:hypothetical protein
MANRLTEEEFSQLLGDGLLMENDGEMESLPAEDAVELRLMQDALRSYGSETLLWAETRSAVEPVPVPRRFTGMHAPQALVAAGIVAVLALGGPYVLSRKASDTQAVAGVRSAAAAPVLSSAEPDHKVEKQTTSVNVVVPSQEVLEADNQLLSSIDQELQYASTWQNSQFSLEDDGNGSLAGSSRMHKVVD